MNTMLSKGTLGVCAGLAGAVFLGYCIYFDQRRRSHPNFKKTLRDKRRRRGVGSTGVGSTGGGAGNTVWPNLKDQEAVQKFFLAQVQCGEELLSQGDIEGGVDHLSRAVACGEELLSQGDIEGGVDHLSRAVAVCGQPQQLLQVLQQTLPPQVFTLLLHKLPLTGESILKAAGGTKVSEEDVE
ncbi:hypothetical protein Pcinc_027304 [Petrolisthes cinctipes]|uniref:Mitochondrial import receptor subunit TOM20 homolog n=1 Tax=Petrolisthes cinctipes TaxID=88211 RepID=A0AAE1K8T8_PETCI|nr:hypothetical protein Pcinc_027304 [Petrolisthes cinctipes]